MESDNVGTCGEHQTVIAGLRPSASSVRRCTFAAGPGAAAADSECSILLRFRACTSFELDPDAEDDEDRQCGRAEDAACPTADATDA